MSYLSSENLQEKFNNIYADFYREHDLVLSSNYSMNWLPSGIDNISKLIYITSKIPFNAFVGFKKKTEKGIILNKIINYENNLKNFKINDFPIKKQKNKIEEFLNKLNKKLGGEEGYEINILSEVPSGHGLGVSTVYGNLIVSAFYMLNNEISIKQLENFDLYKNDKIFKKILKDSYRYEEIVKYGNSSGKTSYNVFLNSNRPQCYISGKKENINFDLYEENNIDFNKELPIDYFLVFSGLKNDTFEIEDSLKNDLETSNKISKYIKKIIKEKKDSFYINDLLKKDVSYNILNDTLVVLSTRLLYYFTEILKNPFNEFKIEEFIKNINNMDYSLKILSKSIDFSMLFKNYFYENISYGNEKIGICPIYSGKKGGGYLIVTKKDISQKTIEKTVDSISKNYPDSYVEVSSKKYFNDNKNYGVKINQYISKGIFSKYIDDNLVILETNGENKFLEYENAKKFKTPILIDCIKRKIYLSGNKLNYKQIHSQNTTIEILEKILNSKNLEISNKELLLSSYRENKNDMSGKIIYPLKKLIFQYLHIDFPLSISGTFSDYVIKLGNTNINIVFIKKIDNNEIGMDYIKGGNT